MLASVAFTFLESLTFDSSIPFVFKGFTDDAPSKVWSTYFTYIRTDECSRYLCIFLDLFSRRVVGSATSKRINAELAVSALEAAIGLRNPQEGLVAHSIVELFV